MKEVSIITEAEKYIAKIIFRNCVHRFKGQQYEDFFVSVMTKADSGFQPVKAYGNIGDQKNDGFNRATGTYYQVYAPDEIGKDKTIFDGVRKLENDFTGVYSHWNHIFKIKNYYFVLNDEFEGAPAPIIQKSIELDEDLKYRDTHIDLFLAKDLEHVFEQLPENYMIDVIGFFPKENIPMIEFEALREVVDFLLNKELIDDNNENLVVPDFDEKIRFNGLTNVVSNQLTTGSYQEGLLAQYFNENPGLNEILQKKFHSFYETAKEKILDTQADYADRRFYYILEVACPKKTIPIQTCVLVLMAHYFSSCDIFEEPPKK